MQKTIAYVISDSVGETAEFVVKAGLSQFKNGHYEIRRVPYVKNIAMIDHTLHRAKEDEAIVGFTLVNPHHRKYLNNQAIALGIHVIDIMDPVMTVMGRYFNQSPHLQPGLIHQLDEDYYKRVEAIEFAVKYDDGRDPSGILKADIVLIGVSRTSKTPLSQYLAMKRFKVANVPIVPEIDPPEELFVVSPDKCIGLSISPEKLNDIRRERLKTLGLADGATYANIDRINYELNYFYKIVQKIGCQVIDVSTRAVEETANIILHSRREKRYSSLRD